MVEELFNNNIASQITLVEAVAKGILPLPTYINALYSFDEDKTSDETNNKINTELQKNKHYMFSEILEKEIGYNGDKGNLPKFLDYLTSYNDYEKYFQL